MYLHIIYASLKYQLFENRYRAEKCKSIVAQAKEYAYNKVAKSNDVMVQYVNTPSCGTSKYPNFADR